ncbi:MFS transporter [Gordonia sp. (in: high G+C Gram-positive bacteria)]|jgi:NNP family nitrate/nitrite transporter-like MFS transporter|uniref:MFS transporter n=1 Tax=Gordonia sp. (in: high G+C Gram-positive bacteria) TaxID=84139 RepID=UPI001D68F13F|nr:MFS transporter [Gordonia sp. (in: high G+C Gram-positive bacteria)]MCB1296301.1 NarK/NasA family nitrate transporter [Gordonia sp. (in: high G+C Gram-positive bacteria)]HMS75877.1 MFS transporter [Gordonia sp. (in: high G+C Gram-positive bacteria)]HQV17513.1 MFS transporter [Gordonia sp. (in: high G+C Gram-positive bacteria)]
MTTETAAPAITSRDQATNLALATLAFGISFWAWNLVGPLAIRYATDLNLSAGQKSVLVAIPVLVGSLGRIITGALTDRYGGRTMFPALLLLTVPFVLLIAVAGELESYALLLVIGFFLGVGGTTFAVGIPFVNAWYDPSRRGFATGVFGAGMGGTALSAFFTPRFVNWFGYFATHVIIAVALVVVAVICRVFMHDSPRWSPNHDPVVPKLMGAAKLPITWEMGFLYAAAFGGFVAFSTYLPTYLNDVYAVDAQGAGTRTAGFAIAAVIARPCGGVLADKFGPRLITFISCAGAAILAIWMLTEPPLEIPAGINFVLMALFMGLGSGSVFTWVAQVAPAERVGAVTGIVGAAGGLGGFFPPMAMGATYDADAHSYTLGLALLSVFAVAAALITAFVIRKQDRT